MTPTNLSLMAYFSPLSANVALSFAGAGGIQFIPRPSSVSVDPRVNSYETFIFITEWTLEMVEKRLLRTCFTRQVI